MAAKVDGRALPKKENDVFKSILKYYETKQYKKGLKASDVVLKKFPNHGETLAMRGLVLNCLDKKVEAYDFVKRGLKADMKSHVCWHVYGLLYRSDRRYAEAAKSYKQALKIDCDNVQILRDLSLLQVQLRDSQGFLETRRSILRLKPNNKMHWVAYALANHLAGLGATAVQVIDAFEATVLANSGAKEGAPPRVVPANYEDSELALYRNSILEEDGLFAEALQHLEKCEKQCMDGLAWRVKRAEMRLYADVRDESSVAEWVKLMRGNRAGGDNYHYHRGLQLAVLKVAGLRCREVMKQFKACKTPTDVFSLNEEQIATLDDIYSGLAKQVPKCDAFLWVPLTYAPGDARFEQRLDVVVRKFVQRGAPALGSGLERFWSFGADEVTEGRARGVEACERTLALCEKHEASLRFHSTFDGVYCGEASMPQEPPATLLWLLYLKSHCLQWLGRLEEAISVVDECIAHTPTGVDLVEKKASILKRMGCLVEAALEMDRARDLDLADRYINNKATKYHLRACRVAEAKKTASMFTKHEGDPEQHLNDMQATWYDLEIAAAYARRDAVPGAPEVGGNAAYHPGRALKKYLAVESHFSDFLEDQFDFHTYCVRKMTLRAYVSLLRFEDHIHGHAVYCEAAAAAGELYVRLYDDGEALRLKMEKAALEAPAESELSADEQAAVKAAKKLEKLKQRKATQKAEKEKAIADAAEADKEKAFAVTDKDKDAKDKEEKKPPPPAIVDADPDGDALVQKDGLAEALRLSLQLDRFAPQLTRTHALCFDVALRRGKALMALRALRRLDSAGAKKAEFILSLARFVKQFDSGAFFNDVVKPEVLALCGVSADSLVSAAEKFVTSEAEKHDSLKHRVSAARAMVLLCCDSTETAAGWILSAKHVDTKSMRPLGVTVFEDALAALGDMGATAAAAEFKKTAHARFAHAPAFL
ncbi:NMDA receptor-regulated protein 1-domain-containing protein [Pelagophyceae sp. CCMP2097]|nr:NMDA receptor-regulated protein 1-domain-containing protein [Pelagophyceae sp. CCMP2097]|mmetsp:Transcript_32762/g.110373  ORF Transcript_32762/g.110373 Transcript_32762/m.110373 type:complete len:935 (+) Transcript_32762:85-2889(+)